MNLIKADIILSLTITAIEQRLNTLEKNIASLTDLVGKIDSDLTLLSTIQSTHAGLVNSMLGSISRELDDIRKETGYYNV